MQNRYKKVIAFDEKKKDGAVSKVPRVPGIYTNSPPKRTE